MGMDGQQGGDAAEHAGAGDHLSPSRALPLSVDIFAGFEDGMYLQYRSNGVNESSVPDRNTHEGACSGDWTLGMISDELVLPKSIKPGKCARNSFATAC